MGSGPTTRRARDHGAGAEPAPDPAARPRGRPTLAGLWYSLVRLLATLFFAAFYGFRASGRSHLPGSGGAMLVSNHLSHLDVLVLGVGASRPLNFVARSTLFFFPLGPLIRSVGAFPIQREGMGAQGLKETLRRIRAGGVVVLFPEGTRSRDGQLAELKSGIAVLAARTRVPIVPAGLAGTFEAWPRSRRFPRRHPIHVHFGPPIQQEELAGLDNDAITALIRDRLLAAREEAHRRLTRSLSVGD